LKPHRYGKMTTKAGKLYTGEYYIGEKQGNGTMTYPNGDRYSGAWHHDKRQGFGTLRLIRGDVYEGEWYGDSMHGPGILTYAEGQVHECNWALGHCPHSNDPPRMTGNSQKIAQNSQANLASIQINKAI
jgi:hypothetical protein